MLLTMSYEPNQPWFAPRIDIHALTVTLLLDLIGGGVDCRSGAEEANEDVGLCEHGGKASREKGDAKKIEVGLLDGRAYGWGHFIFAFWGGLDTALDWLRSGRRSAGYAKSKMSSIRPVVEPTTSRASAVPGPSQRTPALQLRGGGVPNSARWHPAARPT